MKKKSSNSQTNKSLDDYSREEILAYAWGKAQNLDYLLKDHQLRIEEAFLKSAERIFVEEIGRQVGKTYWNCKKAVEIGLIIPNGRIKYASAFQTSVEEYVIPTIQQILSDCPGIIKPKWLASKKKFIFHNGAEIKLLGLDRDPNAGRGPYCDLYIIDEGGFVKTLETIIDSVILPMFNTRPWGRIIISSSSPESPAHPFVGYADKYKMLDSYIKMTIKDSNLTPDRITEIENEYQDKSAMLRELYCVRIVDASLAIIPEWREEFIQKIEPDKLRPYYHNYTAMDLGVLRDFTAGICAYYDFAHAKLMITHEFGIKGPEMTTEKLRDLLRNTEKQAFGDLPAHLRISDNNNPLLIQDLNTLHGISFMATNKTELRAMVNTVRMWVNQGRIIIDPSCKFIIGCLASGVWTNNRKEFDRSLAYGHYDWLAALIYLVRNVDEMTNPIPPGAGLDLASPNVVILPRQNKSILQTFRLTE
jgi:hypothetical protein